MTSFNEADRNAPRLPSETCPDINRLQAELQRLASDLEDIASKRSGPLEELRDANAELRAYGEYWRGVAEEALDRLEDLEAKIAEVAA